MEEPSHFLEQPQAAMEEQAEEQQDLRELFLERQRLLQHPVVAEEMQRLRGCLAERDAELAAARQEAAAAKEDLRKRLRQAKEEVRTLSLDLACVRDPIGAAPRPPAPRPRRRG